MQKSNRPILAKCCWGICDGGWRKKEIQKDIQQDIQQEAPQGHGNGTKTHPAEKGREVTRTKEDEGRAKAQDALRGEGDDATDGSNRAQR
jgi:hypothetical protein